MFHLLMNGKEFSKGNDGSEIGYGLLYYKGLDVSGKSK